MLKQAVPTWILHADSEMTTTYQWNPKRNSMPDPHHLKSWMIQGSTHDFGEIRDCKCIPHAPYMEYLPTFTIIQGDM